MAMITATTHQPPPQYNQQPQRQRHSLSPTTWKNGHHPDINKKAADPTTTRTTTAAAAAAAALATPSRTPTKRRSIESTIPASFLAREERSQHTFFPEGGFDQSRSSTSKRFYTTLMALRCKKSSLISSLASDARAGQLYAKDTTAYANDLEYSLQFYQ